MTATVYEAPPAADPAPAPTRRHRPDRQPAFRPDVEGLRALAVTVVVLFHAGLGVLSGGYVGVDVFFVISGFLITGHLLKEVRQTGTISISGFYARRALRLLPAATFVTAVTVLVSWLWLPPVRFAQIAGDALATTFYGMNYRLAVQGTDYLGSAQTPSPLQHFWSLAVEEQFYVVWPLLLVAAVLLTRRRPHLRPRVVLAVFALIAAVSFGLSVWQTSVSAPWAYFGMQTRAWELAAGGLVAATVHRWERLPVRPAVALRWLGIAGILFAALTFTEATAFPGYAAALPVLATVLVLGAGCAHPWSTVLSLAPVQLTGRLSYGWYLWHWPVLVVAPYVFGDLPTGKLIVLAGLSYLLAAATLRRIEDPLRSAPRLRRRPWHGIVLGVGLSSVLAAAAVAAPVLVPPRSTGVGQGLDMSAALRDATGAERQLINAVAAGADSRNVPANLTPTVDKAEVDVPQLYRDGCDPAFTESDVRKPCMYGDTDAAVTMVLFGDSHAGHWFPPLEQIAKDRGWRLAVVTKSACSAASTLIYMPNMKRNYTECVQWRDAAVEYIRSLRPALVVMSSNGNGDAVDIGADQAVGWANAWRKTFSRLAQPGTRQVLISDTAWPAGDAPECVSAHLSNVDACHRPTQAAIGDGRRRALVAEAAVLDGVTVIDPLPWLCTQARCPVIVGNTLVYKDNSHLTATYAKLLTPVLAPHLPTL
ncbi:acyltransferase family protein [Catellatospora tritici]|uniref:acyltransferase family protein n=1 Tax=Catellatospora tritici TaxID=2851566 RepID=UPI001C2DA01A|nr:acyltransferase family protein [Catellatospora tritici]MBV1855036.1 acyltransferase [Catellatospora tritici]